jgi:hypothetical protein
MSEAAKLAATMAADVAGYGRLKATAEERTVAWRRGIEINRNIIGAHYLTAATLALLGQIDEAKAAAQLGLTLNPRFTIRRFRARAMGDNPNDLAQRERLIDGMRR